MGQCQRDTMMTSSNWNIFRVIVNLCGEFSGHRWIPPHKGQWRGNLMFSSICAQINGCVIVHEAGDLRRHRAHYDVMVMIPVYNWSPRSSSEETYSERHLIYCTHADDYLKLIQRFLPCRSHDIAHKVAQLVYLIWVRKYKKNNHMSFFYRNISVYIKSWYWSEWPLPVPRKYFYPACRRVFQ